MDSELLCVDEEKPDLSPKAIWQYFKTRPTTLFQFPSTKLADLNPMPAFREMGLRHWNWFFLGYCAWIVDSIDFFVVSSTAPAIAETLNVTITDITWGMTCVLMLRSVGAIIFGFLSDTYGRKWPFVACCGMFVALEIGVGFCQTYKQFLAIRSLFGVAMGGMYGNAAATAIENAPPIAHSVLSGIFLPGYTLGYIFAIIFARAFENTYKEGEGWRALCWFSAGPAFLILIWRLFMPENDNFLKLKAQKANESMNWKDHLKDVQHALATHWLIFLYLIFFMAGLNFMSHGTQDLYPTFLVNQIGLSADAKTVSMVVIDLGAVVGGTILGQLSELIGRRLTIILGCVISGAFAYPAFMLKSQSALMGTAFFVQFGVGCWGVAPIHLFELTPNRYRALAAGLVYQLGNLASSASATIESTLGSRFPLDDSGEVYDYGKVMAIFGGCVFVFLIIVTFLGPERFHKNLDSQPDDDLLRKVQSLEEEKQPNVSKVEV